MEVSLIPRYLHFTVKLPFFDHIFYGSDTLFMGVEIELDEGGESDNQARKLLEIANAESEGVSPIVRNKLPINKIYRK